ncbi:MAG: PHP domain-containing protein, partial [Sphingomonadaceae bacterium]
MPRFYGYTGNAARPAGICTAYSLRPMHPDLPAYAELHCLSNFTFLRGASHPEELVEQAAALGYSALALTDECSFAGVVRAHIAAKRRGLKLIVGSEVALEEGIKLVLIAADRRSYGAIASVITTGRRRARKGGYVLARSDLDELAGSGALALLIPGPGIDYEAARWIAARFPGRAWIATELHREGCDQERLAMLHELAASSGLALVAAGDVHMHLRSRRRLQDLLTAIRIGRPVAECGHALHSNAERYLRPRMRLAQIYPEALLAETMRIAGRCHFSLDELRYEYPEELTPADETPTSWLRRLAEQGLFWRFPAGIPERVSELVEHELALIAELRYEAFFLTVYDLVRFARDRGILCQGRGSAANSAVCYALGIT